MAIRSAKTVCCRDNNCPLHCFQHETCGAPLLITAVGPGILEDPSRLSEESPKAVGAFLHEGTSRNTARTYKTALQYWGAWHALRYGEAITPPVSPAVVIQFVVDHLEHQPGLAAPEVSPYTPFSQTTQHLLPLAIDQLLVERGYKTQIGPWSMATVQTRLAALSNAHEHFIANNRHLNLGPENNPMRDARVRQLISAARRAYARRGREPSRPVAATRHVMEALLATCGEDLIGKRDRALLLFGWASGGRRRSKITAATFENVRRDGDGFVYYLGRSKTNQSGSKDPKNMKPIQGAAAEALQAWMQSLLEFRITHGPIFRRILNDRIVEPLKDGAAREIIRWRARMADQPLGKLSAHSLRSGFVTEAGKQGISLGETMAMTGHRSVQTVMGYYQSGELSTSRAARLLDCKD
jgi:integrase